MPSPDVISAAPSSTTAAVLKAEGVTLRFGGVTALSDVSIEVRADEMLAVIGPNGAGKSSLMNVLSGFYRPQQGRLAYEGRDLLGRPVHEIARQGVVRTFQGTHLFPHMTVLDNILIGRHAHMRGGLLQTFAYFPWTQREEARHRQVAEDSRWARSATACASAWTLAVRWPWSPRCC